MTPDAAPTHVARVALVLALILFLFLGAHQLSLPGLHYDEAREAGVNAMQIVTGQPVTAFRDATIRVGPVEFPLMVQDYIGATNVLLAIPFLALGGVDEVTLRWMPLALATLTLVLTWFAAKEIGGPVAALVAVSLLAVNPSFIFFSRQGVYVTNVTALLLVAMLYFWLRWRRTRRTLDLCVAAFLMGLGIYSKLLFVWAVVGIAVLGVVIWVYNRAARKTAKVLPGGQSGIDERALSWRAFLAAVLCLILPLIPLIVFNLRTGGTVSAILENLGQSYYGVDNTAYLPNLRTRISQIGALLRGDHFWYLGEEYGNPFAPWLAAGLLALALAFASPEHRRRLLAPVGLLLLIVAQSAFTVSDLFITHYAMLIPLIPISAGVATSALLGRVPGVFIETEPGRSASPAPALVALSLLSAITLWWTADLWTAARYHDVLSISGGYAAHSDAVYDLAAYLDQFEPAAPLALDWGLDSPVRFLTMGRVNPVEVFGYDNLDAPDPGFADRVAPFLEDPRTLYLAHAPDATVFQGRVDALAGLAEAQGLVLEETARFSERNGRPLFIVYRATLP
jgi:4-amino-4-deoxy-L-arabinose transferase-like glycosyltransferase